MDPNRFTAPTTDTLAKRANFKCSNPYCGVPTSGPHADDEKSVNIGVAAHIRGANPGSARFDPEMTPEERRSITNGIWLCQNCAKLIDNDVRRFTVDLLYHWKQIHELGILEKIGYGVRERKQMEQADEQYSEATDTLLGYNDLTHLGAGNIQAAADTLREIKKHQDEFSSAIKSTLSQTRAIRDVSANTKSRLVAEIDKRLASNFQNVANGIEPKVAKLWQDVYSGADHFMKAVLLMVHHKAINSSDVQDNINRLSALNSTLSKLREQIGPFAEELKQLIAGNGRLRSAGERLISVQLKLDDTIRTSIAIMEDLIKIYKGIDLEGGN